MKKPNLEQVGYAFIRFSDECSAMPAYSPDVHKERENIRKRALRNLRDRLLDLGLGHAIDFSHIDKEELRERNAEYSVYTYISRADLIRLLKKESLNRKTLEAIEKDAKKFSEYTSGALTKQAKKLKLSPHSVKGWEAAKIAIYKHAKIRI